MGVSKIICCYFDNKTIFRYSELLVLEKIVQFSQLRLCYFPSQGNCTPRHVHLQSLKVFILVLYVSPPSALSERKVDLATQHIVNRN